MIAAPGPIYPWPIGPAPRYQPAAANPAVRAGHPVGELRCANGRRFAVHLELFASRRVAVVPRGIGIAGSGCRYPVSTDAPTGVVEVLAGRPYTLGDLFRVWGRRLGPTYLLSFRGRVTVFVNGRRVLGKPQNVRLAKHDEVVVEVGPYVAPHVDYLFPKGVG